MPITASGFSRNSRNAARPMAGAVFRPTGSASTCAFGSFGSCFVMAGRKSSLVMIQNFFGRSQRQQPRHRLLNHRLLAVERQQLLGALLAAQRPEARAAPSSQNYGIEIRVLSHGFSTDLTDSNQPESQSTFSFPARQRLSRHIGPQRIPAPTAAARRSCRHTPEPPPRRPSPA